MIEVQLVIPAPTLKTNTGTARQRWIELKIAILEALQREGSTVSASLAQWDKTYKPLILIASPGTYYFNIGTQVIDWSKA